jgi:uncharacterized membrane protein
MTSLTELLTRFVGERPPLEFLALLVVHIAAGLTCVVAGAGAMLSTKGPGRHPAFGTVYYWVLLVVFLSSSLMSLLRWSRDYDLFVLGAISFVLASLGYSARKIRWTNWPAYHVTGMGGSYIVLLTAFYVDNGPQLPLWDHLPVVAFWILPTAIGGPIMIWALLRHPIVTRRSSLDYH